MLSGDDRRLVLRVALDLPTSRLFDYFPPDGSSPQGLIGRRVLVPFGRRRMIGLVCTVGALSVEVDKMRPIVAVLDDAPALTAEWIALVEFAARYYQRGLGETALQSLPLALRSAASYRTRRAAGRGASNAAPAVPACAAVGRALEAIEAARNAPNVLPEAPELPLLTPGQVEALNALRAAAAAEAPMPVVLHGITGSGKTEVYLRIAEDIIGRGGQVLVLVPEINLTPQLLARFTARFGERRIVAMHSGLADGERLRAWLAAATGAADVVLGTRLAVFAPLPRIALIIVDEEHDPSYKQQEGLRYSARDLAVWRAYDRRVPIVLGSATPAFETWANAAAGRYLRVAMPQRARTHAMLPAIELVDTAAQQPQAGLAPRVVDALRAVRERGQQSLVFLNRRGYAPVLACSACGWVAACRQCTSHVVFHKADRRLQCHHCGWQSPVPSACPTCGNQDLAPLGRGTQRIEESLHAALPGARLLRIDADSTRRKGSAQTMLDRIHAGEIDVLLGTQMIAKGHDFERVALVCVLGTDAALFSHDFRAPERLFQQLMQVAGRSGRADAAGRVLVQTRYPKHPMFGALVAHDYARFAQAELDVRRDADLPPFSYQAIVRAEAPALDAALGFLQQARDRAIALGDDAVRVYDAVPMRLTKRAGVERAQLLVESNSRASLQRFLPVWLDALGPASVGRRVASVKWHVEVDPLDI